MAGNVLKELRSLGPTLTQRLIQQRDINTSPSLFLTEITLGGGDDLQQCVSTFSVLVNHLRDLVKRQIPIQQGWYGV